MDYKIQHKSYRKTKFYQISDHRKIIDKYKYCFVWRGWQNLKNMKLLN